jgi:hypothetical protein
MDTQDDASRSSEEEQPSLIPHPDSLELSVDEIRRFQEILNAAGGKQYGEVEAKYRGLELLQIVLMLLEPKGYDYHIRHPLPFPGIPLPPPEPDRPPTPQAFPIKLDGDHAKEIDRALKMLADELRSVRRRPTHWRWALVALYDALGHTLAAHRPASFLPYTGLGQLTRLFDAVVEEHPELPQVRASVETVDRLRTTWIARGVTRWPVGLKKELPGVFLDCVRIIGALEPTRASTVERLTASLKGAK